MLESALTQQRLDKAAYKARLPDLREALLNGQFERVEKHDVAIVVVIAGMDGSGKAEVVYRLYEWLDVHYLETHAYGPPKRWTKHRPHLWRYWQTLPEKGATSVVLGSWYHQPIAARLKGEIDDAGLDEALAALNRFEAMLSADGIVLLKLWLHVDDDTRKARVAESARGRRVVMTEWDGLDRDEPAKMVRIVEHALLRTSTAHAPWHVIASGDRHSRDLSVGEHLRDVLTRPPANHHPNALARNTPSHRRPLLEGIDLSRRLDKDDYHQRLDDAQARLRRLAGGRRFRRGGGLVVVFEGSDAAGKGGAIRRVTACLDPRQFRVHPIGAPTQDELARPYLWRFWRRLPLSGQAALFDRSWYGRVLVERVDGLAAEADWMRAYDEINDFEQQLVDAGMTVVKFWLAISKDEQRVRFEARESVPFKRFKLGDADWHARAQWDAYQDAASDMVARTSTPAAPWTLIAAEDKRWARVQVVKTLCERLSQ